ncbi:hypothetical protein CMO93_05340 [Candidatus Woesearchaeota archaeon]|jgi:hypothetical protein|nr:hypothetical protein [Candidatus Woesearchaeota archaeon]|tara:strand:- start:15 stop:314 length:300 start_codon:yes stop_codon:yes gene_type:complete
MNKQERITIYGLIISLIIALFVNFVNAGCCTDFCFESFRAECPTDTYIQNQCKNLESCTLGCCIDEHGFQHNKFPQERCIINGGVFKSTCESLSVCKIN